MIRFLIMKNLVRIGCVLLGIVVVGIFFMTRPQTQSVSSDNRLTVATSFYPLAHFIEIVGGEAVLVIQVVPDGAEPHDYEPSVQDLAKLSNADLLFAHGAGIDPWMEEMIEHNLSSVQRGFVIAERMTGLLLQAEKDGHEDEWIYEYQENFPDPHFWLSPDLAKQIVALIAQELSVADPVHAQLFAQNATRYQERLQQLDTDFQRELSTCKLHDVVVAHDAFQYWQMRYDVTMHGVIGVHHDEEPSAQDIADIVTQARALGVHTIFFEEATNPALAQTIAEEIDGTTAVLHPIETLTDEQRSQGKAYLSLMQENLHALQSALNCQ